MPSTSWTTNLDGYPAHPYVNRAASEDVRHRTCGSSEQGVMKASNSMRADRSPPSMIISITEASQHEQLLERMRVLCYAIELDEELDSLR